MNFLLRLSDQGGGGGGGGGGTHFTYKEQQKAMLSKSSFN